MSEKEKLIEEALQENRALKERVGILGECLHLQSENLRELESVKERLEKLEQESQLINYKSFVILSERIGKLEEIMEGRLDPNAFVFLKTKIDEIEDINILSRLVRLEAQNLIPMVNPQVWDDLSKKIQQLEVEINTVRTFGSRSFHPKRPYKCPVCEGSQRDYFEMLYPYTQYPDSTKVDHEGRRYQECRACEGKGIVWG